MKLKKIITTPPHSSTDLKAEMQKLFGETCGMLNVSFETIFTQTYIELCETYRKDIVRLRFLGEMYLRISEIYEAVNVALKPFTEIEK